MARKFQRKKENFTCQVCRHPVKGDGYTNHCPFCLFSKHVDVNPGDRREKCRGLMEPVGMAKKKGKDKIVFKCQKCGLVKLNRPAENDDRVILGNLYLQVAQNE